MVRELLSFAHDPVLSVVEAGDPVRWIVQATTVLERVIPEIWDETQSPIGPATAGEITATGPNADYLAVHDQPGAAHPSLRKATRTVSPVPTVTGEARQVWDRLATDLEAAQLIVPPACRTSRIKGPQDACTATRAIRRTAQAWHTQGRRATDFRPVLDDTAHVLRRIVEHDVAGWVHPRRHGVRACKQAGVDPRCRVSPVRAKGLCSACYQRALREARCGRDTKPVNQTNVQVPLDISVG